MTGLLFAHPEWLAPGLALAVALSLALAWAAARSRRALRALLGSAALEDPALRRIGATRSLRDGCLAAALFSIGIGLLGPRLGRELVELSTSGVDVVVLLDTSRSMDARDVPPSRFDVARRAASELVGGLAPGDRAALAAFAGRGLLLTPLTPDRAALLEMIASIETQLVRPGGSNLPAGVAAALEAFAADERPRAIFVLSDGEAPGHAIGDAAVAAVRANTRVFAAAFGTQEGATIPDHGVPLRDAAGEVVTSSRRLHALEEIARRTGGGLFVSDEWGRFDVAEALRAVRAPVAHVPGDFVAHPVTVPMVVPFAVAAAVCLLLEWLARGAAASRRPLAIALIGAVSLAASLPDTPGERPPADAGTLLRAGLERAARGDWAGARERFLAAALSARDPETSAVAYHDLGVAALHERDLAAARDAFFDALAAAAGAGDPDRVARTQWNLEWVLARLAQGPETPAAGEDPPPRDEQAPRKAAPPEASRPLPAAATDAPEAPPPSRESGAAPSAPRLDEAERSAWLSRVADDPRRSLLSTAFERYEDRRDRTSERPTW